MNRKNNSGFTFVELLAVIMILVFISLVTTPVIKRIITSVRKSAFTETVNRIITSGTHYIEEYLIEFHNSAPYPVVFTCDGKRCSESGGRILDFSGDVPISGTITIAGADNIYATYVTNNKWCASGYKGTLDVADTCTKLDHTAPIIKNNNIRIASTTDKVIVIFPFDLMKDDETDIVKYIVNIKKGEKVLKSITRSSFKDLTYVVFNKLDDNTIYDIEIVGYNGNNLNNNVIKTIKTNTINNPTIKYSSTPILIQNNYYKSQDILINFNNDETYIKSTKHAIINKTVLGICDDYKNNCTPLNTKEIKAGIWYKVEKNIKLTYDGNTSSGILYLNNTAVNLANLDNEEPSIILKDNIIKSNIVILNYEAFDSKSKIGSYTCKYGTNKNMNNESTYVNSSNCLINDLKPNTEYYYEICVKDRIGNSKCESSTFKTLTSTNNFNISYDNEPSIETNDYFNKQIVRVDTKLDTYYIYSSKDASIDIKNIYECGSGTLPLNCSNTSDYIIKADVWYKVSGNIKILYSNDSKETGNLKVFDNNIYNVVLSKIENTIPSAPTIKGGNDIWTNEPITVSIDNQGTAYSGVMNYEYLILDNNIKPTTSFAASGVGESVTITDSGTKYIYFRTVSNGNIKSLWSDAKVVKVDFESPYKTQFSFVKGYSSTIPQKSVQINLSAKDNIGIKNYEVDIDGNGTADRTCDNVFIPEQGFSSNHLRFRAVDYAGNVGDWSDEIILKIEN